LTNGSYHLATTLGGTVCLLMLLSSEHLKELVLRGVGLARIR
jgi:hypothetical protein